MNDAYWFGCSICPAGCPLCIKSAGCDCPAHRPRVDGGSMTRQINADQVVAGDVIVWCGRRSVVRGVEHGVQQAQRRSAARRFVRLSIDVPELAPEGHSEQNGLFYWGKELVALWDEP